MGHIEKGMLLLWPLNKISSTIMQVNFEIDVANPERSILCEMVTNIDLWEGSAIEWQGPAYFSKGGLVPGAAASSSSGAGPGPKISGAACMLSNTGALSIPALAASSGFLGWIQAL